MQCVQPIHHSGSPLNPVDGNFVEADFDAGTLSADAGARTRPAGGIASKTRHPVAAGLTVSLTSLVCPRLYRLLAPTVGSKEGVSAPWLARSWSVCSAKTTRLSLPASRAK